MLFAPLLMSPQRRGVMKKIILTILWLLVSAIAAMAADPPPIESRSDQIRGIEWLYEPYYAKGDDAFQRTAKILTPVYVFLDAYSTDRAIKRGFVEGSRLYNSFIPLDEPAFGKRFALQLGINYGIGHLLDFIDRKTHRKYEVVRWMSRSFRATLVGGGFVAAGRNFAIVP